MEMESAVSRKADVHKASISARGRSANGQKLSFVLFTVKIKSVALLVDNKF
jgi:hypothetical protein